MGICGAKANAIACDAIQASRRFSRRSSRRPDGAELNAEDVPKISLDELLKSVSHCKSFEKFIMHQRKAAKEGMKYKIQLNFLHFCLDVRDYKMIPADKAFRKSYAHEIFDSYLTQSSAKSIAISSSDARTIEIQLQQQSNDLPDDLFDGLLTEAKEYLTTSYEEFLKSGGNFGLYSSMKRSRKSLVSGIADTSSDKFKAQTTKLKALVKDMRAGKCLMEFLEPRCGSEGILFLMDAAQYKDTVTAFDSHKHQDNHFLYKELHRIYSKYIKTGSKLELFPETLEAVQKACSDQSRVQGDVFDKAVDEVACRIANDHFADFLNSPAYQELCHRKNEIESRRTTHLATLEQINKQGLESVDPNAPTLKEVLETNLVTHFHDYMSKNGGAPVLLFWQEVAEFKRLPHTQTSYIKKQAKKIFNKFIKRGAHEEINLPAEIRADIMKGFDDISVHIFDSAQMEVQCEMDMDWYIGFLMSPNFKKMLGSRRETSLEQQERRQHEAKLARVEFRDILDVPEWQELFHKFLVAENCGSLLLFWVDASNFQQLPKSTYLVAQSKKIYTKYIAPTAKEKMNLSPGVIQAIEEHQDYPSPAMFADAQKEIFDFMATDLFKQFHSSPFFQELDLNALRDNLDKQVSTIEREEVNKTSFDADDLATFLTQPEYRKYYVAFCEETLCAENIYFWIDCEDFKLIPSDDYVALTARKIYQKYVKPSARNQVNLKDNIVKEIEDHLQSPKRTLFLAAQEEIAMLMEKDTFARFKESPQMKAAKRMSTSKPRMLLSRASIIFS